VSIVNESGRPELAEAYRTVLEGKGYRVTASQAGSRKAGAPTIYYRPGQKARADALAGELPGRHQVAPWTGPAQGGDLVITVR
jgi:hypothetical protein